MNNARGPPERVRAATFTEDACMKLIIDRERWARVERGSRCLHIRSAL